MSASGERSKPAACWGATCGRPEGLRPIRSKQGENAGEVNLHADGRMCWTAGPLGQTQTQTLWLHDCSRCF